MAHKSIRTASGRLRLGASFVVLASALSGVASAQQAATAPPAADPSAATKTDVITVFGYRESLEAAINTKRNADVMVDAINADDIASFPDANLAESIQRLPGVSIDRENGEGRTITVRGLGSDFTRVRLNGLETLSTTAASDSGTNPNRGRGFDFNTFASDLFQELKVTKTASAEMDEGSLGATVDLVTGKPLSYNGQQKALSVEGAYYENGESFNPRIAGLFADQFLGGRLGVSASFAYNERDSENDRYRNQPGSFDYAYRGSTFAGSPAVTNNSSYINRQGFAAPVGTACSGADGVVPNQNVSNLIACDAMRGSVLSAYNLINAPRGQTITDTNPGAGVTSTVTGAGPLALIPALYNIEQQDLSQERLGITAAMQYRPDDFTNIQLDFVSSKFEQSSEINQIQSVGLNRNNTVSAFNTSSGATSAATRRGTYATCTTITSLPFRDPLDCGGTEARPGGVFAGFGTTSFSTNPNNLEPFDYYNNPGSPGYPGASAVAAANGMYFRDAFIGRPSVRLLDAGVDAYGNANYLKMNNIDWRSATDASYSTTDFQQWSVALDREITSAFNVSVLYGMSSSKNDNDGQLVEFNRMNSPGDTIWDARGGGDMPELQYGFDVADPASWDLVKGFSSIRHYVRNTDNKFTTAKIDFDLDLGDGFMLEAGYGRRAYKFATDAAQRNTGIELINPTAAELGIPVAQLGKVYTFGDGLDVPGSTPKSFFAPNISAFRQALEFDCDCVNKWGDWRMSRYSNPANQYQVRELDNSYYAQLDWDIDLFGHRVFGNAGVREAKTEVVSSGYTTNVAATGPRPISVEHEYTDTLGSLNVGFELTDDLLLRFGASDVMARPLLGNLAPAITAISVPTGVGATSGGTLTIGNPKLSPFAAENIDFSVEWYFAKGALLSAAVFRKDISNVPQTVVIDQPLQQVLGPEDIAALIETQTDVNAQAYITSGQTFNMRTFMDAPGGKIEGWEIGYQQNFDFDFLPEWARNFGAQANYTHLDSTLHYIVDPGSTIAPLRPRIVQDGPWTGASPDAFNITLYYETDKMKARISGAQREEYITTYPIAAGTCDPGFCDSPLINDFIGSEKTFNLDGSFSYNINDMISVSLEVLNITDQRDKRWMYDSSRITTQYMATGRQIFVGLKSRF